MADPKSNQQPPSEADKPADPERRKVLVRLGTTIAIAGAAGLATRLLYDGKNPVRDKPEADSKVSDHRVAVARWTQYGVLRLRVLIEEARGLRGGRADRPREVSEAPCAQELVRRPVA